MAVDRQVGEVSLDLIFSHILRMTLIMGENKTPDPVYINIMLQKSRMLQLRGLQG